MSRTRLLSTASLVRPRERTDLFFFSFARNYLHVLCLGKQHEILLTRTFHRLFRTLGCSWTRFWYLIDEFRSRAQQQTNTATTSATSTLKQSDERFRQFFWNNFIQEDDTYFYKHTKPSLPLVQSDVVRKIMALCIQEGAMLSVLSDVVVLTRQTSAHLSNSHTTSDSCEHL